MSGTYAASTEVRVSSSIDEIKRTLKRFGAEAFGYAEMNDRVAVTFQINELRVHLGMSLPSRSAFLLDSRGRQRTDTAIDKDHEQACRQRWRTMANGIKAKLAMIDDGISTVEHEFLAYLVLPTGETVGDRVIPDLHETLQSNELPPLMIAPKAIALGPGKKP